MKFIYERKSWPEFRWDVEVVAPRLAAVRFHQGRLVGRIESAGKQARERMAAEALAGEVLSSSQLDQVPPIEGLGVLLTDVCHHFTAPLTRDRLNNWHALLAPGRQVSTLLPPWRGDPGNPQVIFTGPGTTERKQFEPPPASRLTAEMAAFLKWFNGPSEIDPVLKAALAQLWFSTVQPFAEGNGRIARAIAELSLARAEESSIRCYSLSAQTLLDQKGYATALESTQLGGMNVTDWIVWFLECLDLAITDATEKLTRLQRKSHFDAPGHSQQLNPRQRQVLSHLVDEFEGKLTSTRWARLANTSADTALRDINDLVMRGVLVRETGGGRSTSYRLNAESETRQAESGK